MPRRCTKRFARQSKLLARFVEVGSRSTSGRSRAAARCEPLGETVAGVVVVAAEELVAALAGERDLDVRARELGDEVRRDRRRVREGLVERRGERGQELDRVRAEDELVVVGPYRCGDESRELPLVEAAFVEADRERA